MVTLRRFNIRERIEGLTNAIRQILKSQDTALSWREICLEIGGSGLLYMIPEQGR